MATRYEEVMARKGEIMKRALGMDTTIEEDEEEEEDA